MKARHPKTTKPKRRKEPTAARRRGSSAADLQKQLDQRSRELAEARKHLAEALEQQTATSEVLQRHLQLARRAGAGVPGHAGERDADLRGQVRQLWLYDGDAFRRSRCTACRRPLPSSGAGTGHSAAAGDVALAASRRTKQVVHIADFGRSRPTSSAIQRSSTRRTRRRRTCSRADAQGERADRRDRYLPPGGPPVHRQADRAGQNFAAQAVIAIENTRLLNELRSTTIYRVAGAADGHRRRCSRSSRSSPGELEPVFQAMLENAMRICEAKFGNLWLYEGDALPRRSRCTACRPPLPSSGSADRCSTQSATPRLAASPGRNRCVHIADLTTERPISRAIRGRRARRARRRPDPSGCADAQGERTGRRHHHLPPGGPAVHRQADRAGQELRRTRPSSPSRTPACSTSCAGRSLRAGAADRHRRRAQGHQSARPSTCKPCLHTHARERGTHLRGRRSAHVPVRGRLFPSGRAAQRAACIAERCRRTRPVARGPPEQPLGRAR